MHDIEPYFRWRDEYISSEDEKSPYYKMVYDEFTFRNKIYNYFVHPQWDSFGSNTLYAKVLFADYEEGTSIIELIGEWNDCLKNDIMFLKRELVDELINHGIHNFLILCDNVLNFHGSDNSYYEEWWEDIQDEQGWICFLNLSEHVMDEMESTQIQYYVNFGQDYSDVIWQKHKPNSLLLLVEKLMNQQIKQLH